jgi:DNA mismatch repair protein MutL
MAGRIAVLDSDVVAKIAAGEVVERPASVVKELVENSLDAGATRIEVEASEGGKSFIRVSDDGEGMCKEDTVLSFKRHATSKVQRVEDLEDVTSLGFRGEALPSVAAVSRVELTSAADGEATTVVIEGGKLLRCEGVARSRGTSVVVKDLFYNVPARRKYLGSGRAETRRITQTIVPLALARPAVGFTWKHEGRVILICPPGQDLTERAATLLGRAAVDGAVCWDWESAGWRATGLLGSPRGAVTTRRSQYFFVNRRPVWSPPLRQAVEEGYRHSVPEGRHPLVVLQLVSTGGRVDANVHPTKREVRFPRPWELASSLGAAIRSELSRQAKTVVPEAGAAGVRAATPWGMSESKIRYFPGTQTELAGLVGQSLPSVQEAPPTFWQLHKTYILSAIKGGLVVIDQHAAHERIIYEEALQRYEGAGVVSQQLLFPVLVELSPAQAVVLQEELESLARLGLAVKPFGGTSFVVEAVPPGLEDRMDARLVKEMVEDLEVARRAAERGIHSLATILACHTAVRAGQELRQDEMQSLVDRLFATKDPQSCPHGRPTFLRVTLEELDRRFHRR